MAAKRKLADLDDAQIRFVITSSPSLRAAAERLGVAFGTVQAEAKRLGAQTLFCVEANRSLGKISLKDFRITVQEMKYVEESVLALLARVPSKSSKIQIDPVTQLLEVYGASMDLEELMGGSPQEIAERWIASIKSMVGLPA